MQAVETRTLPQFSELPAGNQLGELENITHALKITNFTKQPLQGCEEWREYAMLPMQQRVTQ